MIWYGCIPKYGGFINLYCAIFLVNLIRYVTETTQERIKLLWFPVSGNHPSEKGVSLGTDEYFDVS